MKKKRNFRVFWCRNKSKWTLWIGDDGHSPTNVKLYLIQKIQSKFSDQIHNRMHSNNVHQNDSEKNEL